jgi:RecA-family ATPase
MTEEIQNENVESEVAPNNVNIGIDQMLAAILASKGKTTLSLQELIADYTGKQITINQEEDGTIAFDLIDLENTEKENNND